MILTVSLVPVQFQLPRRQFAQQRAPNKGKRGKRVNSPHVTTTEAGCRSMT